MKARKFSEDQIKDLTLTFKLLGDHNRLSILLNLTSKCHSVSYIIKATGLTQTNVSFHLRKLRQAGLVRVEPRGAFKYY
ncbi:MAG TPA: ArsR family transcriptional regulator [Nitrospirae bacterium]|nr:ArsR family transcriptional regulator [Nitrospirota bacterium]